LQQCGKSTTVLRQTLPLQNPLNPALKAL
jgi:hypothetical protein